MARPTMAIGTYGRINFTPHITDSETGRRVPAPEGCRPTIWRARCKFRDADGVVRNVERWGTTKGKAETTLKAHLTERQTPIKSADMRPDMRMGDAGVFWLEQVRRSNRADSTKRQYADNVDRYLTNAETNRRKPCPERKNGCCGSLQGLTLREANSVAVIERWMQRIADNHGEGAARTARKILSGILNEAVRHGVLPYAATGSVRPAKRVEPKGSKHDTDRALTRDERASVLNAASEHPREDSQDVADLMHFLAGTGVRLAEALTCTSWTDVDLDAEQPTARVRGTKTDKADRVLPLPEWLADRLRARAKRHGRTGLVFGVTRYPTKLGEPRDRRNVTRLIEDRFNEAGLPWATSHTFRRTVATWLDESGAPLAEIANQLGHANVNVTATYLGRRVAPSRAASVL